MARAAGRGAGAGAAGAVSMRPSLLDVETTNCTVCGSSSAKVVANGRDYLHETSTQSYTFCRCDSCGHIYLNPRPSISEIDRVYPADYATFSKRFAGQGSLFARIKDTVLLRRFETLASHVRPDMRMLDIGCGDGRFLMALRRRYPSASLAGLDWSFGPGVENELAQERIDTITGAIESAELPEASFDVITMNQLIEHVWDVPLVLERCRRALKAGGLLSIETPNPDGWDRTFFKSGGWGGYYWPRHLNLFSRRHLRDVVERAGFKVVLAEPLLAPPCWIYSVQFTAQRAGAGRWIKSVFADNNPLLLAGFAVIDRIALAFGAETSNQKLVASRVD